MMSKEYPKECPACREMTDEDYMCPDCGEHFHTSRDQWDLHILHRIRNIEEILGSRKEGHDTT